jgi:hypothetical protein
VNTPHAGRHALIQRLAGLRRRRPVPRFEVVAELRALNDDWRNGGYLRVLEKALADSKVAKSAIDRNGKVSLRGRDSTHLRGGKAQGSKEDGPF